MHTSEHGYPRSLIHKAVGVSIMVTTATLLFVGSMSASTASGARVATCSELPDPPIVMPADGGFQGGLWSADTPTSDYYRLLISCESDT